METIKQSPKVLYTARTRTTGGRKNGTSKSSDGKLDIRLSTPGTNGDGTNPEQLFAAGWSACFEETMVAGARKMRVTLPEDTAIDAEVDLQLGEDGYSIRARLNINLPGMDRAVAQELVDFAHENCPYSKALRGNVDVEVNLV